MLLQHTLRDWGFNKIKLSPRVKFNIFSVKFQIPWALLTRIGERYMLWIRIVCE